MRSKVVAAEMATAAGIPTVIASGQTPGDARWPPRRASAVGTRFRARAGRYSSFKLWLKYAKPTRGRVLVDAGAARALREGGTSLLPVGIVEVSGEFDAGDAVEIAHDGELVGKGICNYSAEELRRVRGLKSARCASCCRAPPTRPSTGTTSCSRNSCTRRMATHRRHPSPRSAPPPSAPSRELADAAVRGQGRRARGDRRRR